MEWLLFVAYYFLSISLFSLFPVCYPGNRNYFVRCGCCCSGFTSFSLPFFSICSLLLAFEFFFRRIDFFRKCKKTPHYPLKEIVAFFCALYPVVYMYSHVTLLGVMAASPLLGFVRRAFECIGRFGNREGKLLVWLLITAFCLMVKMAAFVVVCGFSMLVLLVTTKNLCYFLLFNMEVFKLLLL